MPTDQGNGSLQGHWPALPINVVIDRDFYLSGQGAEADQIKAAINTWNNNWAALKGMVAFNLINDGSGLNAGAGIPVTTDCAQATITAARFDAVGIWKIQAGGDGANTRTQADGTQCKLLDTGIQGKTDWVVSGGNVTGASILLNFDQYNNNSNNLLDVQSLTLHELGHVLGLLHSCNPGPGDITTAPSCDIAPQKYTLAVMFPYLQLQQLRRALTQNDYSRVNCLY